MFKLVIVGTIAALAAAQSHPVNENIVNDIKQKTSLWQPMNPSENPLANKSMNEIFGLLGTHIQGPANLPEPELLESVPESFDSRQQWPSCIHPIRDQAQCGSCWAFAATETLSDRFCIASSGKTDVILSPQDLVSCDTWNQGCNGGILSWAWSYLTNTGAVTDSCFPYES